ncbi:regulatory protein, luxR family [Geodermatophilus telluris]|uniref:Regulatory protein, luxR family n=1 Tax=Geodermatophilus telluris TaxID=1190417 RepID=A0A1G6JUJ7_9ACTN|nr:LuxR C-terminal-related transcriptional regulator [Geodermatophilus telluris]SDC22420.1 regulatory protein, luxR family [Geodermatophilus telluris]
MSLPAAARPDDRDALRAAVREVRAGSGMSVAFAGPVGSDSVRIEEIVGARTRYLRGLDVRSGAGLGGRVLREGRPAGVEDYSSALDITHDYDGPVLAEGLCTVAAAPVLVTGRPRAVLYAASRENGSVGDRVRDALGRAAARMAAELAVRDEVDRRLALMAAASSGPPADADPARWEEVRAVHADLRLAAQATEDAALRDRLLAACTRLAALGGSREESGPGPAVPVHLSGREVDVLTQVALGCSNREAAARLSLRPETVKSYLGSAMTKLDAHTRLEAVVRARRLGLLP